MGKIAGILPCLCTLSVTVTFIHCDLPQQVSEILETSKEDLYLKVDEELRQSSTQYINYPVSYWNKFFTELQNAPECGKFPPPYTVKFENFYWQTYETNGGTFRLYNSYLDTRELAERPTIRILAMVNRQKPQINLHCLLWFDKSAIPVVSQVSEYMLIWRTYWLDQKNPTAYLPFLINCPVPDTHRNEIPTAVTLAEHPCELTRNVLKVMYEKPESKQSFAICVKGLDFPFRDISFHLIEWIESNKLLGVDKIIFYKFQVHPNVEKVLDYYTANGYIEVIPLTYSEGQPHVLRAANDFRGKAMQYEQLIPYNDCWNRNIYKFDYISLLDIDELIIPRKAHTWKELITIVESENQQNGSAKYASYVFREARFVPKMVLVSNIPFYMTMSRRILRLPHSDKGIQSKSIHDTEQVLTLHNHYYIQAFQGHGRRYEMDVSVAQLNHYRYCESPSQWCPEIYDNNTTVDISQWKYFKVLKSSMVDVMTKINFKIN